MFNEEVYNKKLEEIHDLVTCGLSVETKKQYELFRKFMHLYETENRLEDKAFRDCLKEAKES